MNNWRGWRQALLFLPFLALLCSSARGAGDCPPCKEFDRLDKQIRDGALPSAEGRKLFAVRVAELDAFFAGGTVPSDIDRQWVFPLRGYDLATTGAKADEGYVVSGYDYFAGNRHGGHPSFDLFIRDDNQDALDDRTGEPVTVVSMTGGIVAAAETAWPADNLLRGGKYLWIYDPGNRLLLYYAHNRDLLVNVGDRVVPGTAIATVGRSGVNAARRRSPTHLHLTVLAIRDGHPVPENIIRQLRESRATP